MNISVTYRIPGESLARRLQLGLPEVRQGNEVVGERTSSGDLEVQAHFAGGVFTLRLLPGRALELSEVVLEISRQFGRGDRIFANGFQSWTHSREFGVDETIAPLGNMAAPFAKAFGDQAFFKYPNRKGHIHGWTYGYATSPEEGGSTLFIGSLNEYSGYTLLKFQAPGNKVLVEKDCSGLLLEKGVAYLAFDLLVMRASLARCFEVYGSTLRALLPMRSLPPPATGWTSWYNYYTSIDEGIILKNLQAFAKRDLPLQYFQIDDGWQAAVGDWMQTNKKFPNGLRVITDVAQMHNYQAGLWLAPFICEKKSQVYRQHPDWLLRRPNGKPVKAGYNALWRSWMYPLDFYNPQVREYLGKVFDAIFKVWGFGMVKLDFLYAVALQPPRNKTRGQVMFEAMQWLNGLAKGRTVLGCGVPLGAAFGAVDYCRIGADVHAGWDLPALKWANARERPSTINTIHNTIFRRQLGNIVFGNDPDVSILRSGNNKLLPEQRYTLFLANQIFGRLQFVSDYLNDYDTETLKLYLSQFPFKEKDIHSVKHGNELYEVRFGLGRLRYIAYLNLAAQPAGTRLPDEGRGAVYFGNKLRRIAHAGNAVSLKPYESVCFLEVPEATEERPFVAAGSSGHLFPASEIGLLEYSEAEGLRLQLHEGFVGQSTNTVYIRVAEKVHANARPITVNGRAYRSEKADGFPLLTVRL